MTALGGVVALCRGASAGDERTKPEHFPGVAFVQQIAP